MGTVSGKTVSSRGEPGNRTHKVSTRFLLVAACALASLSANAWQPLSYEQLHAARITGDMRTQRAHAWQTLGSLVRPRDGSPAPEFTHWQSEARTFHPSPPANKGWFPGPPVTTSATGARTRAGGPLMTFIHYNKAAHDHIRRYRLHEPATLDRLLAQASNGTGKDRVPPLPPQAAVAMTAWWPISGRQPTPMPVWDPERKARLRGANGYLSWPRTLAIVVDPEERAPEVGPLAFAGRTTTAADTVGLERFFYLAVNERRAEQLMTTPRFRNAAVIALGRPLAAGDFIALVGLHLMTAELDTGVWATFWWHDQPDTGPFAASRPPGLTPPWDHYLMDVTFDARRPLEPDGSPNICFNPWFDATFPDRGGGNGVQANCISCHQRAGYPITRSMRVTRGESGAPAPLQTGLLWSLAKSGRVMAPLRDK